MITALGRIKIAGDNSIDDWRDFEKRLVVGGTPGLWNKAYKDFFKKRLDTRFIEPIEALQETFKEKMEGAGFSVVALQCCLIEFLESTAQGRNYRHRKRRDPAINPETENELSGEIFVSFLQTRRPFKNTFQYDKALAEEFYSAIRCAVLHEASTKNPWKIWKSDPAGSIVDGHRKILYRDTFQKALLEYVEWYESELPKDTQLQAGLIRKFDHLCR